MLISAILIIDDESIARQILRASLEPICNGHEVVVFACAQEALDWAVENPVALVLTDYRMPTVNGIEFIRRFRDHPGGAGVPVILVSGDDDPDLRSHAMAAGATDYMLKPVHPQACAERCKALLEIRNKDIPFL